MPQSHQFSKETGTRLISGLLICVRPSKQTSASNPIRISSPSGSSAAVNFGAQIKGLKSRPLFGSTTFLGETGTGNMSSPLSHLEHKKRFFSMGRQTIALPRQIGICLRQSYEGGRPHITRESQKKWRKAAGLGILRTHRSSQPEGRYGATKRPAVPYSIQKLF